jgi:hypothetical protein
MVERWKEKEEGKRKLDFLRILLSPFLSLFSLSYCISRTIDYKE